MIFALSAVAYIGSIDCQFDVVLKSDRCVEVTGDESLGAILEELAEMIAGVAAANNGDVVGMIDEFVDDTEGVMVGGIVTGVKGAEVGGACGAMDGAGAVEGLSVGMIDGFAGGAEGVSIDGIGVVKGLSVGCIVGNPLHVVSNVVDIVIGC